VIEHMGDGPSILFATTGVPIVCIRRCFIPTDQGVAGLSVRFVRAGAAPLSSSRDPSTRAFLLSDLLPARGRRGGGAGVGHRGAPGAGMYFALSGAAPHNKWLEPKPPEARLLMGSSIRSPFRTG